jgi:urocanate hydratase
VADGTEAGGLRVQRTLNAETSLGMSRYADAGYGEAAENARRAGIRRLCDM